MDSFAQWFWLLIWWFLFFAYLVILFQIIGDLFRDRDLERVGQGGLDRRLDRRAVPDRSDLHHRPR